MPVPGKSFISLCKWVRGASPCLKHTISNPGPSIHDKTATSNSLTYKLLPSFWNMLKSMHAEVKSSLGPFQKIWIWALWQQSLPSALIIQSFQKSDWVSTAQNLLDAWKACQSHPPLPLLPMASSITGTLARARLLSLSTKTSQCKASASLAPHGRVGQWIGKKEGYFVLWKILPGTRGEWKHLLAKRLATSSL